jgi:4-hydroxy-tetrahydrodipicolinate synthase
MVGVSHPSTARARELCQLAREVGADAVQCLIPNRPSGGSALPEELTAYFQRISQATDLPIFAYHNPGPGAEVTPQVLHAIYQVPGVEGFKESSRNLRHIGLTKALLPPEACYFCTMEVLLATLELGCAGGTMPPPGSLIGLEIIRAFREGRWADARRYQQMFAEFPARWMRYGLAAVMKVAMAAIGVPVGDAYPPFAVLPPEDREAITAYVSKLPLPREVS